MQSLLIEFCRSGIWNEKIQVWDLGWMYWILEIADDLECRRCRGWPCGPYLLRMLPSRGGLQLRGHNLPHAVPVSTLCSTYLVKSSRAQVEGNVPRFEMRVLYFRYWYLTGYEQRCPSSCRYFIFSATSCLCYGSVQTLAAGGGTPRSQRSASLPSPDCCEGR